MYGIYFHSKLSTKNVWNLFSFQVIYPAIIHYLFSFQYTTSKEPLTISPLVNYQGCSILPDSEEATK